MSDYSWWADFEISKAIAEVEAEINVFYLSHPGGKDGAAQEELEDLAKLEKERDELFGELGEREKSKRPYPGGRG